MKEIQPDVTVSDVLEAFGADFKQGRDVAQAMGVTMDELGATKFGTIDSDQVRAIAVTLRRSADEVLAIANAPAAEIERRKAQAQAAVELEDAATVLAARAQGVAHVLKQMGYADGTDSGRGAACDLLADALEDAAIELEQARATLYRLKDATI